MSHPNQRRDSAEQPLGPLDALLLNSDSDPARRAIVTLVMALETNPRPERVVAAFEKAAAQLPRMRQRVRTAPFTRGVTWRTDPDFDVVNHIRFTPAPSGGSLWIVLDEAGRQSTAELPPARPLWDATVYDGGVDRDSVMVLRIHHAVADGVRILQMLAFLLESSPVASPPLARRPSIRIPVSGPLDLVEDLARDAARLFDLRQSQGEYVMNAYLGAVSRPVSTATGLTSYVKSARRTFDTGEAKPSPLLRDRSSQRRFRTMEIPLRALRESAHSHEATVNDVYLAALLGGFARYHEANGVSARDVPMCFPINVAGGDVLAEGNHFSAAAIPGPASMRSPGRRIRAVHRLVASRRAEHGVDALVRLAPALREVPPALTEMGLTFYSQLVDLQASNVVGPETSVYLGGARLRRFYGFGPLPGIPVMVLLVSYDGVCSLGFNIDPVAVTDPDLLVDCTRQAFTEILDDR